MENDTETQTQTNQGTNSEGQTKPEINNNSGLSVVEQARAERIALEKVRDDIRADKNELVAMKAEEALGGRSVAGETAVKKEETAQEYNARIDKEISEGKHDD